MQELPLTSAFTAMMKSDIMCNLATDAFALGVDVARAVAGETGPLKDAQPWGEDTLPPNMTGDQKLAAARLDTFVSSIEPTDIDDLPEWSPPDKLSLLGAVRAVAVQRTRLIEVYMAGMCMHEVRRIAGGNPKIIEALNARYTTTGDAPKGRTTLSQWSMELRDMPLMVTTKDELRRRKDLVEEIYYRVVDVLGKTKVGAGNKSLSAARQNVFSSVERLDLSVDLWRVYEGRFLEHRGSIEIDAQTEAQPMIEDLRQLTAQRRQAADEWLVDKSESLQPGIADIVPFLTGRKGIDELAATEMAVLMDHLTNGTLNTQVVDGQPVSEHWRVSFLTAILAEMSSLQRQDELIHDIQLRWTNVPEDIGRPQPLWQTIQRVLSHWDHVQRVLALHHGAAGRTGIELANSWLEQAKNIVANYEEIKPALAELDDIYLERDLLAANYLTVNNTVMSLAHIGDDARSLTSKSWIKMDIDQASRIFTLTRFLRNAVAEGDDAKLAALGDDLTKEAQFRDNINEVAASIKAIHGFAPINLRYETPLRVTAQDILSNWDTVYELALQRDREGGRTMRGVKVALERLLAQPVED
jgi:hypothetical protein